MLKDSHEPIARWFGRRVEDEGYLYVLVRPSFCERRVSRCTISGQSASQASIVDSTEAFYTEVF